MKTYFLKLHSIVDLITNSSTEIFILDTNKTAELVYELIKEKCKESNDLYDLDWCTKGELSVTQTSENTVKIFSWLNEPDWLQDWLYENFTVISHD